MTNSDMCKLYRYSKLLAQEVCASLGLNVSTINVERRLDRQLLNFLGEDPVHHYTLKDLVRVLKEDPSKVLETIQFLKKDNKVKQWDDSSYTIGIPTSTKQ